MQALGPALLALATHQGWMLALKDAADGRYLFANAALADFLGQAPEHGSGEPARQQDPDPSRDRLSQGMGPR